ncbi:hypothetical protein LR48_Vigan10g108800 [Vigna angularis]|uniref:Uncharacterized protein n=1 Tax=Phaseolus angularis TaxID=3914 RepID=A0A0L9VJH1_PHAAN|nr:hypothetical protein LR48_Vigan10g108800 [Vigna angularis]
MTERRKRRGSIVSDERKQAASPPKPQNRVAGDEPDKAQVDERRLLQMKQRHNPVVHWPQLFGRPSSTTWPSMALQSSGHTWASSSRPFGLNSRLPKGLNRSTFKGLNSAFIGLDRSATAWPQRGLHMASTVRLSKALTRPPKASVSRPNAQLVRPPKASASRPPRPQPFGNSLASTFRPFGLHSLASKGLNCPTIRPLYHSIFGHSAFSIQPSGLQYSAIWPPPLYGNSALIIRPSGLNHSTSTTQLRSFGLYYSAFDGLELSQIWYRAFSLDGSSLTESQLATPKSATSYLSVDKGMTRFILLGSHLNQLMTKTNKRQQKILSITGRP